ncbi:MAG: nickel pincer cofactor biosynthesis protein LarC [Planctomycetaceae bacterium]|nr:nickel pincer cofactor biosynthesis protein LarC [Planctomycetaceae bacterium]
MKIAYLDCLSGISGDMTLGALVDAGVDLAAIQAAVDSLKLPSCKLVQTEVKRKGFRATKINVEHEPEHAHRHLHHITDMIDASELTPRQKDLAKRIFTKLGEAEAKVHGTTIRKVHFHEVGAVDSIADICGAAVGWDLLGVDRIVCSPVPTGRGFVQIEHGRCSIPAPATAELLQGVPLAESHVDGELTTPTGAAILATLVDSYGPLPSLKIDRIGYGSGDKDFATHPNILRLFVGESVESAASDQVWVVETNLDDVSGEIIGYCTTKLWEKGALDVYTTSIQMKKNRPGTTITVLCQAADLEKIEKTLFRETGTLGVRRWPVSRHKMERKAHSVETQWGPIEGKLGWVAGQEPSFAPEFEACRKVAEAQSVALKDVYEAAHRAFDAAKQPPTA